MFEQPSMHMLQHQAGAAVCIDLAKVNALFDENAVLARELGKAQERGTRFMTEKAGEIATLNAQLMKLRAENVAKDSRLAFLADDMDTLKSSIPDFDSIVRLQTKVEQMTARQRELESQNTELRQKLASTTKSLNALSSEPSGPIKASVSQCVEPRISPVTLYLKHKTVLCVGGRTGNIANYREVVERVGGRFAHHGGGVQDSQNILDASLAAADLVICQTGCISHNAYWKVKDFCKRTGKRCVFVENPSASSLVRGLEKMSVG